MAQSVHASALGMKLIAWRPALLAGLIGSIAYLLMQFLWTSLLTGEGAWVWVRMSGAIVLGRDALPPPDTFDAVIFIVALLVHVALSLVYGVVLALLVSRWDSGLPRWKSGISALIGAVFGLLVYLLNYYVLVAWFPWFADLRHEVTIFNNVVFGAVTAFAYVHLSRSPRLS